MLKVYSFQKGAVAEASPKDLSTISVCWADCTAPSEEELKEISENTNIALDELNETLDQEERPKVSDLENYSVIIVRTPWDENGAISTLPIAIFVSKTKNNVITLTLQETKAIKRMKELLKINKIELYEKGVGFFTYSLIDEMLSEYFATIDRIEEAIDEIEEEVVQRPGKKTIEKIFAIKKTLIFFHRALTANREVISSIEKEYITQIDKKNIKRFRNLYNDAIQLIDTESTYRDILTGTLDIYLSSISNNLNQVLKTLTVIASFILMPTLIAGIYGMNFDTSSKFNMPELLWEYGYFFAIGLMALSVLLMYWFFKRKGWI